MVISTTVLLVLLFVLGLLVGSFLNVVIARVPHGQSIVRPGSRCPRCGHVLSWYENVPLLSWVALRARCRGCRAPISARYPAVELLTGLLFLAAGWAFGWSWELLRALLLDQLDSNGLSIFFHGASVRVAAMVGSLREVGPAAV